MTSEVEKKVKPGSRCLQCNAELVVGLGVTEEATERLNWLAGCADAGLLVAHMDREYPLADINRASDYLGTSRARGKVLIRP